MTTEQRSDQTTEGRSAQGGALERQPERPTRHPLPPRKGRWLAQFSSIEEELRHRMSERGTSDPAEIYAEAMAPRLAALMEKPPQEREALLRRGARWRLGREGLGLSDAA